MYCIDFSLSDTDECLVDNGGCQQRCINIAGSYSCDCGAGFRLADDRSSCEGQCHDDVIVFPRSIVRPF